MSLKKKIKKILPDRCVYMYQVLYMIPKYLKSKIKARELKDFNVKFMDDIKTVDRIVNDRMSLARFGDGEFMWMTGNKIESFQSYSEKFAQDLRNAFICDNPRLLIGIPYGIFCSNGCNLYAKMHWQVIRSAFLKKLQKYIDVQKVYSNASITRPYIDYRGKKYSKIAFENLRRIWDEKEIVFVEGEKTKLGMGNNLFDNAKSIRRIICPAKNAYEKIEEIKDVIRKNVPQNVMILGALGPTASILATQLTEEGYQFIDIGHVDIEYMWYQKGTVLRTPIEGKYVNESGSDICSRFYDDDPIYINSIIGKIL